MQFNPGDGSGIVDEVDDICNSDSSSYPLTSKARRLNLALARFYTLRFQSDSSMTEDDLDTIVAANLFTGAETTTEPDIPAIFTPYICRLTSLPHLVEFQKGQKNDVATQIQQDEREIMNFYGTHNKTEGKFVPATEDNK